MKNKQVLVYGLLQSINDLRSNFVGHIHFKKLMKFFINLLKYFTVVGPGSGRRKIWENVILRNILNSTISVKYFTVA